jgi:hypothetical protein
MLKRAGEVCKYRVPGFSGSLTESEHALYRTALGAVKGQLRELTTLSEQLNQIPQHPESNGIGGTPLTDTENSLMTRHPPTQWQVLRKVLSLELGNVLLCARNADAGKEYAIVQQFPAESLYAKANGQTAVLEKGNDCVVLVGDYVKRARLTIQFMASDAVAHAQEIIWKNSNGRDMSRVVRSISAQFTHAVSETVRVEKEHASLSFGRRPSIGIGFKRGA